MYVCGLSQNMTADYKMYVADLKKACESGDVKTNREATEFLAELFCRDTEDITDDA